MTRIFHNIHLGDFQMASDRQGEDGWYLVQVAYERLPVKFNTKIDIYDGSASVGNLDALESACRIVFRESSGDPDQNVYVYCASGISRSPAVVLGTLMLYGMEYEEANMHILRRYPRMLLDDVFQRYLIKKKPYFAERD